MNKLILSCVVCTPLILLTGCTMDTAAYEPGYSSTFMYSTQYNSPEVWQNYYLYRGYNWRNQNYYNNRWNWSGYNVGYKGPGKYWGKKWVNDTSYVNYDRPY